MKTTDDFMRYTTTSCAFNLIKTVPNICNLDKQVIGEKSSVEAKKRVNQENNPYTKKTEKFNTIKEKIFTKMWMI